MVTISQRLALSVRERLLLHLLSFQKYENEFELPEALTQAGISKHTRIARPNVSRAMKLLATKELVYEKLSHIKGHKRQKKIYLLTTAGLLQASELDRSLGSARLKYRNAQGKIVEKELNDIMREIPGNPGKLEIISSLDDNGLCDHNVLAEMMDGDLGAPAAEEKTGSGAAAEDGTEEFVYMLNPSAELRHFYGRKSELARLQEWYTSVKPRAVIIHGIPGIGKTTLVLESANRNRHRSHIVWYRLRDWDNLNSIARYLAKFFQRLGKSRLGSHLDSTKTLQPVQIADIVSEELSGIPVIFVLDDLHNATEDIIAFLRAVVPQVEDHGCTKFVLLTRELIKFYDRRDVVLKKSVVEFSLEGLDEQSSRRLLGISGITDDEFASVYLRTGGHPLYLELLESASNIDENTDIYEFIHEEVFSKLSDVEIVLLKSASVYRYPVLAEAFFDDPNISYGHIDSLVSRSFLVRHGLNLYDTHDLIRSFFYSRLTRSERLKFHGLACDHYRGQLSVSAGDDAARPETAEARMELQYHLQKSGQNAEALKQSLKYGRGLIDAGRFELLTILDEYDLETIEIPSKARILALKGEILTHLGDTRSALGNLNRSLRYMKDASPVEKAMVLTLIGENHAADGSWKQAAAHHNRALKTLNGIPAHKRTPDVLYATARSYNNLGLATRSAGEPEKAVELYQKALEILDGEDLGTALDRTAILENLGLLLVSLDELDSARQYFERALAELERESDHAGLAKLCATLGDIYVELGDIHTASEFFEKGVSFWELAEDPGSATRTFFRLGQLYSDRTAAGSAAGADAAQLSYWERLLGFFSSVQEEDYRKISRLYDRIGALYMHRGSWHRSLEFHQKALELFAKINDDRGIAKAYNNLGVLYRTRQEVVKALESYKKSLGYLEKAGEVRGLAITHLNIGRLYERMNKTEDSKRSYRSCIDASGEDEGLKQYKGLSLLGLARLSGAGTNARIQFAREAVEIFKALGDERNLDEAEMLIKGTAEP